MAQLPLSHRPRQPSPSALSPAWKSSTGFCGRRASGRTARRAPQRASAARNRSGKTKRRRKLRDEAARRSGKTKRQDEGARRGQQSAWPTRPGTAVRAAAEPHGPASLPVTTNPERARARSKCAREARARAGRARPRPRWTGLTAGASRAHFERALAPRRRRPPTPHQPHQPPPKGNSPEAIPPRQFPRGNSPGGISAQRQSRQRRPPRCLPPSPPLPACFSIPAKPSASQPSSRPRATTRYPIPPPTPLHSQCAA